MSSRLNLLCELNLTNSVIFPRKLHKNICSGSGPNLQMSLDIENIIITDEMLMLRWQCAVLLPRCYCDWVSSHHCNTGAGSHHHTGARLNYNLQHAATGPVQWSTLPSVCPPWCLSMAMSPCRHQSALSSDINMFRLRSRQNFYTKEANLCIKSVSNYVYWTAARLISQNCGKSSQFFLAYNLLGNLHNNRSMLILEIVVFVLPD